MDAGALIFSGFTVAKKKNQEFHLRAVIPELMNKGACSSKDV